MTGSTIENINVFFNILIETLGFEKLRMLQNSIRIKPRENWNEPIQVFALSRPQMYYP